MVEDPCSSSAFIEGESSPLATSETTNMNVIESEVVPERFTTPMELSHEQLVKAFARAQDVTRSGKFGSISNVVVGITARIPEPLLKVAYEADPLNSVPVADVHEEKAVDYEGSTGEEPTVLSFRYNGLWDHATDTPSKRDMRKFSYLLTKDLKAINSLDCDIPSRKV